MPATAAAAVAFQRRLEDMRSVLICAEKDVLKLRRRKSYVSSIPLFESDSVDADDYSNDHPLSDAPRDRRYYEVVSTARQRTHRLPYVAAHSILSWSKV